MEINRVGLIGAGRQGRRLGKAIRDSGEYKITVVDIDQQAAVRLAKELRADVGKDWRELTSAADIDIIVVCTPPNLHAPICIAAMENGKHVLCEKPLAPDTIEAKNMVQVAERKKVRLQCGFNLRFHPGIKQAKKWLDEGLIGTPVFARCRYGICGSPDYDKDWRANASISGGGELLDQGVHVIDLFRWFLGDFSEVTGFTSTSCWDIAPLEDNVFALLRTAKGQIASMHASWTQWKNLFSFEVFGRDGYVTVKGLGGSYGTEQAILAKRTVLEPFTEKIIEFRGEDRSWHEEWKELVAAIKENREPLGAGTDGLEAIKIAYAIYESVRKKRVINI
jgi:predicted dehydrogenase